MTIRLPLQGKRFVTLFSAYTQTMINPGKTKEKSLWRHQRYHLFSAQTGQTHLPWRFNTRVVQDNKTSAIVFCTQGIWSSNENILLLQTCAAHNLLITNRLIHSLVQTTQTQENIVEMHPHSKHWHFVDYIIVKKRDKSDIRVSKAMCRAECWNDHMLIISKLNLMIQPKRRPQSTKPLKEAKCCELSSNWNKIETCIWDHLCTQISRFSLRGCSIMLGWLSFFN